MARPRKNRDEIKTEGADIMEAPVVTEELPKDEEPQMEEPVRLGAMTADEMESMMVERVEMDDIRPREHSAGFRESAHLSAEQKGLLLRQGMKDILDGGPTDGRIPTMVRCYENDGISSTYAYFDIDVRTMERAYAFYRDNAENPTPRGCMDLISEIYAKPKRIIPRVALLTWNGAPPGVPRRSP